MGRPNRDFTTDNRFHVINRGVDSQDLFSVDDDWVLFESLIANACDNYGLRINAYALMSNHYHVLIDLTDCDDRVAVSESFGVVQSTYANYFNNRTHRAGHSSSHDSSDTGSTARPERIGPPGTSTGIRSTSVVPERSVHIGGRAFPLRSVDAVAMARLRTRIAPNDADHTCPN